MKNAKISWLQFHKTEDLMLNFVFYDRKPNISGLKLVIYAK